MKEDRAPDKSRFTEFFVKENLLRLEGFERWAFEAGMLFLAPDKWWGDRGKRALPHEGVDFCLYLDRSQRVLSLDEGSRVPVMYRGVVVKIIGDFLGESIIVAHALSGADRAPLLTIYGHTAPVPGLFPGAAVEEGEVIATTAPARPSGGAARPHLHLSAGTLSGLVPCGELEWNNMNAGLVASNPLDLLADGRYRLVEHP